MKREWTLYFAASTALLALYIASKFALDREAAGEAAQTSPLAVVVACTLVSVPTLLFATLASRSWRYGPVVGSRGGWAFAAVTVASVWGRLSPIGTPSSLKFTRFRSSSSSSPTAERLQPPPS